MSATTKSPVAVGAANGADNQDTRDTASYPGGAGWTRAERLEYDGAIRIAPGTLHEQVDAAESTLLGAGLDIYQQNGAVVRVGPGADGETAIPRPVSEDHLHELIGRVTTWTGYDARTKTDVPKSCPRDVARAYLARGPLEWRLPRLAGIINAPTLRADGSVFEAPEYGDPGTTGTREGPKLRPNGSIIPGQPGYTPTWGDFAYDCRTGLLLTRWGAANRFPLLSDPDGADADEALDDLDELLSEFPFVDLQDYAVALAAILTACIRRSLPAAPMFAFTAPAPGTGKSCLVDVVSMIATGRAAAGFTWSDDQAENRKQLDAALLAGASVISLDNVTAELGGDRLNQVLTQPSATVRVLGESRNVEADCSALVISNGNNLAIAADMTRRTMLCRLDAGVERPEMREFTRDPLAMIRRHRGRYIRAALTILRAYHVAGRPNQPKPLGSFEVWSSWVRGAVMWVGCADPVASMDAVRESDPRRSETSAVLEQWARIFSGRRVSSAQVINAALTVPDFREALLAVAGISGAINTRRLGAWLSANKGKLVGGLKVEPAGMLDGTRLWTLRGGGEDSGGSDVVRLIPAEGVARAELVDSVQ